MTQQPDKFACCNWCPIHFSCPDGKGPHMHWNEWQTRSVDYCSSAMPEHGAATGVNLKLPGGVRYADRVWGAVP